MSNYATKSNLQNISVDTSNFATKTNLNDLKTKVDKFDIAKLVPVPNDLAKLSNVVKIESLKTKVDGIGLSKYIQKTKYDTEVGNLKLKIPDISGLLQTSVLVFLIQKLLK